MVYNFASVKHLTINIDKSKTLIFNNGGRLIRESFTVGGNILEPVQSFCYLAFDVKASGTVKHAMRTLYDKANKAMRPLFNAIAKFNIPVNTAIRLFHTYIAPISLYNAENFLPFTEKQLKLPTEENILNEKIEVNLIHRKFLKYMLGVWKSAPNITVLGDTGEIPLLLKGYRLLINYWYRLHTLPDETLAKKALIENVGMRTVWVRTIEKLLNTFQITYTENNNIFKANVGKSIHKKYLELWEHEIHHTLKSRLEFYKTIKGKFGYEEYLDIRHFELRKNIAKLRCSSHDLEIEKGRHKNKPRNERLCLVCDLNEIETEEHFLIKCPTYQLIRRNYDICEFTNTNDILISTLPKLFGQFITDALEFRKSVI